VITIDFNKLPIKPGSRILDIGCGHGRHTSEAVRFKNVFAMGIDIELDCVVETKNKLKLHEKLGEVQGRWALSVSDIERLPFRDQFFDVIICAEVLEHIPNHHKALKELERVLKPGKTLAISVPRYLPERICWVLSREYRTSNRGHIRIYTKKGLLKILEQSGFNLFKCHYAHGLHTLYWWLKCVLTPSRDHSIPVVLYHRFLSWDIMKQPWITRFAEKLLNPILGKSIVLYFRKRG
jgi:SAM-dependent methyltransferase